MSNPFKCFPTVHPECLQNQINNISFFTSQYFFTSSNNSKSGVINRIIFELFK